MEPNDGDDLYVVDRVQVNIDPDSKSQIEESDTSTWTAESDVVAYNTVNGAVQLSIDDEVKYWSHHAMYYDPMIGQSDDAFFDTITATDASNDDYDVLTDSQPIYMEASEIISGKH